PRQQVLTLAAPALIPLSRYFRGELPIAKSEREGHRERNRTEQDRECGRDDIRRNAQLLQRHEDSEKNHSPAACSRQCASAVQTTRRCLNQTADESADH